jgi:hypothetical protein
VLSQTCPKMVLIRIASLNRTQEANDALDAPISYCSIPFTDFKPFIMKYILKPWQNSWVQQIHNKLHKIHSLVGKTPCSYGHNRKEQVVLTRCRIGHGRLTQLSTGLQVVFGPKIEFFIGPNVLKNRV